MEPLFDTSFVLSSPIYMSHNATRDLLFSMGAPSSWKMMDALLQWLSILVLSCLHGFAISLHHIQASKLDIKDKKSWRLWRKNLEEKFSCFPSGLFSQRERLKVLHSRTLLSYWITTFNYPSKSIFFNLKVGIFNPKSILPRFVIYFLVISIQFYVYLCPNSFNAVFTDAVTLLINIWWSLYRGTRSIFFQK